MHVADSLSGLEVPELAARAADRRHRLGRRLSRAGAGGGSASGAGRPGRVGGPQEAVIDRLVQAAGDERALHHRARGGARGGAGAVGGGREAYDAVTARAVGSARRAGRVRGAAAARGGVLVAWKGARDADEEAAGAAAAGRWGWRWRRCCRVEPFAALREPAPARVPQDRAHAGRVPAPAGDGAQAPAGLSGGRRRRPAGSRNAGMGAPSVDPSGQSTPAGTFDTVVRATATEPRVRRRTTRFRPTGTVISAAMGTVSRSQTRRAGWARPPPPSTSAPASPMPAIRRCWSTSTRSATPRLHLGCRRTASPTSTTASSGDLNLDRRGDPQRHRGPRRRAVHARPGRRQRRAAAHRRLGDDACATALGSVRERYLFTLLDCPPSLGPLTVNALVAADRVIVPVQTEYFALEGLAQLLDTLSLIQRELNPRLTVARDDPDDARRAHAARARRRARGARALPRARLRHGGPAQRPARRGAELRPSGAPARARRAPAAAAYLKLAKEVAARG